MPLCLSSDSLLFLPEFLLFIVPRPAFTYGTQRLRRIKYTPCGQNEFLVNSAALLPLALRLAALK